MRDLLVTLAVFGSLPAIFFQPYIGVLVWSWLGYMNPHRISWGFATTMPFAEIVAITTLVALVLSKEPKRIPWTRETVLLVLFILWMCLTTFFALTPDLAWPQLEKVLKIQVMTFVTLMLMTSRRRLELLVWVIALSLAFYGVKGGLFTLLQGGIHRVYGPPGTFIGGNNEIGLALIMTVPLLRYLQLQATQRWLRWALGIAMVLTLLSILGTQSRGAFLGLAAMVLLLIWKSRRRVLLTVVLGASLAAGYQFMPESWHERMASITQYQEDKSAQGRLNAWGFAWNLAKDRPLLGGGYNVFLNPEVFARYAPDPSNVRDAHSIYFEVMGEHGLVGFGLFMALWISAWRTCGRLAREVSSDPEKVWISDLARMIQVSLTGYAVGGAFLGLAYFDLAYHLLAIVILLKVLHRQEVLAEASTATRPQPAGT